MKDRTRKAAFMTTAILGAFLLVLLAIRLEPSPVLKLAKRCQRISVAITRRWKAIRAQAQLNGAPSGFVGMGHGTKARRPTACTTGVAYWATDEGNWNQSGNSFGQGNLYICTATNTWTLSYTPYTYPHPFGRSGLSTQESF